MALNHGVEKLPQRRECLVFGGLRTFDLAEIVASDARRGVSQLQLAIVAPDQKPADDPAVSAPGVFPTRIY